MEGNPYATGAAAPAPSAPALDPEQQKLADYAEVVQKNTDYFIPKFENYDNGGSRLGWNWPAFFITGPYFLYRKMWLWGVLYIFYPLIMMVFVGIGAAVMIGGGAKGSESAMGTVGLVALLLYFAPWILLPAYANSLYWRKVNKVIDDLPPNVASQPDRRARRLSGNGGTSIVVPLIVSLFGGLFGVGMMAAISIPAYQDYTIRSQVHEGLTLANGAKAAVAEYHERTGEWPADNAAAGWNGATGKYTTAVDIDKGSIIVSYGNEANPLILKEGGRIALTPGTNASGEVVWVCGGASAPPDVDMSDGPAGIEIADKHVPSNCRAGPGSAN